MSLEFKKAALPAVIAAMGLIESMASNVGQAAQGTPPEYYAGGATLPAIAYVGTSQATTTNPAISPSYNTSAGGEISYFGYFLNNTTLSGTAGSKISYCQTGSGAGKRVLNGTTAADGSCAPLGSSAISFGAPTVQTYADFIGTDAPLSSAEYNTFATNVLISSSSIAGRGEPVQLPALVGSIALFYHNSSLAGSAQINLTNAQVCSIASGAISNWTQISSSLPSKTVKFVYRSDGSGTTFNFTNYLKQVCPASPAWSVDQAFYAGGGGAEQAFPQTGGSVTNFLSGNGNPGVVSVILATDGAIGYAEAANAKASTNAASGENFATINGNDPLADLPAAAQLITPGNGTGSTVAKLVFDRVIGAYSAGNRPALATVAPSGTASCVVLVDPSSLAAAEVAAGAYPIDAVTYLAFSSTTNSPNQTALQNLSKGIVQAGTYTGTHPVNTIDSATAATGAKGYSSFWTQTGSAYLSTIVQARAGACIGS